MLLLLAGELMGVANAGGPFSLIGYKHGEAVFDGKANLAAITNQKLIVSRQWGLAVWVEGAPEQSQEGIVHNGIVGARSVSRGGKSIESGGQGRARRVRFVAILVNLGTR